MEEKKSHLNLQTRKFELTDENDEIRIVEIETEDLEMIFKGYRPRLMSPEDFKAIGKLLRKELAQYLKGELVHLSKVSNSVWEEYTKDLKHKSKQRGHTYVKSEQKNNVS